ncbi:hypothetical protein B0H66DRAFT_533322 [Apodospora peruviana]|uniref:Uncharacterized protein n=1 Tax=Apodospora peruviana TaxID=516989 RepID=A0AAE0M491_9PEZI|nr:hypothetical protein B0H66DRAFT_533322 [Apodospora peruviana]
MLIEDNVEAEARPTNGEQEKGLGEQQASAPPVPTETPPPVPENTAAPRQPSRPARGQAQLPQPLPSAHPSAKGQHQPPLPSVPPGYIPDPYYDAHHVPVGPPAMIPFSPGWHKAKLVLEISSLLSSAVIIGLGIALGAMGGTDHRYSYRYSYFETEFAVAATTAGLAIVWNTAEALTICLSRVRKGMHPGAHVGFHLIIWLMGIFTGTVVGIRIDIGMYWDDEGYYDVGIHAALFAFVIILILVHFTLFVRACVETHQVNRAHRNRRAQIQYIQVPVAVGVGGPYAGVPLGPAGSMQQWPYPPPPGAYPPQMMMHGQQQAGNGQLPPEQAVLYGGYYAPAGPQMEPAPQQILRPRMNFPGYYAPAPPVAPSRRSSSGRTRRSRQEPTRQEPPLPPLPAVPSGSEPVRSEASAPTQSS